MDYNKQAEDFLRDCGVRLTFGKGMLKCPKWCDEKHMHGLRFNSCFIRNGKRMIVPFWNSLNDKENGLTPRAYDVLASISHEAFCPSTFKDFCDKYGYDEDSISARSTFKACLALSNKMHKFFTFDELEKMQEIR